MKLGEQHISYTIKCKLCGVGIIANLEKHLDWHKQQKIKENK